MRRISRRQLLGGFAWLGAAGLLAACDKKTASPAVEEKPTPTAGSTQPKAATPKEVKGILTFADVEKAEKEGGLVFYGPDLEKPLMDLFKEFNKLFPKIDTGKYMREQTGRLYAKLSAERQAGTFLADIFNSSDVPIAMDFQKKGGFAKYEHAYLKDYETAYQSKPAGYYTYKTMDVIGIVYNSKLISEADAPKTWKDLLNPKWRGAINFKDSASGYQGVQWLMLRKLYGEQFWKDMAAQKPRGLASNTQQFERVINGEDLVNGLGQYGVYLTNKQSNAPLGFVFPSEGVVVGVHGMGIVDKAPHPEAAKLFMDWMMSPQGQEIHTKLFSFYSPRKDVAPPAGGKQLKDIKVLLPDWDEYAAIHSQFLKEWNDLVGL